MTKLPYIFVLLFVLVFSLGNDDCAPPPAANYNKEVQARKAAEAAEHVQFSANSEIENIKRRLELTSNPEQIGFVLLLNDMGQPIMYTSVKGKVTSGGKRLTSPEKVWGPLSCGQYCDQTLGPAPSDEGTWGSSDPYVYFWTTNGQYIQWNGSYLYSDQPFRINSTALVILAENKE